MIRSALKEKIPIDHLHCLLWWCWDCCSFSLNSKSSLEIQNNPNIVSATCWSTMVWSLRGELEKMMVGAQMLPLASLVACDHCDTVRQNKNL